MSPEELDALITRRVAERLQRHELDGLTRALDIMVDAGAQEIAISRGDELLLRGLDRPELEHRDSPRRPFSWCGVVLVVLVTEREQVATALQEFAARSGLSLAEVEAVKVTQGFPRLVERQVFRRRRE